MVQSRYLGEKGESSVGWRTGVPHSAFSKGCSLNTTAPVFDRWEYSILLSKNISVPGEIYVHTSE